MPALTEDGLSAVKEISRLLQDIRSISNIGLADTDLSSPHPNFLEVLREVSDSLLRNGHTREAEALRDVSVHCTTSPDFGGLGFTPSHEFSKADEAEITFLVSAYLEALNYQDRHDSPIEPLYQRPAGRRGMTLAEKIFAAHDVERRGEVQPGDVIRLDVDWIIASELSWGAMEKTYDDLGRPGIFRNDRVWLAGDHVVDPRVSKIPRIKALIERSERARQVFKLTEYQGMNYTIMHSEFCRERAQPGMLIIGSDSHTCSAGSVSSLAIGLGVADVTLPLVTGETWIKVPETVEIRFINKPKPGLGGKDVILYVLKQLKRNTVAADRVVEYTGSGLKFLSCDARFAISNMTTEFGGVTGIFVPDDTTRDFVERRKNPKYKKYSTYYRPDDDARYAESYIIDLNQVESFVARYPKPDDVVPVSEVAGIALDGCFIGACTTAYEDLVLAALVLEVGLKRGMKPTKHGKRKVVPGSKPILHDLRAWGLADVYEQAGFEIGVPGCSYCVGMSADKAGPGEVWLSSQNRNFENRMGPGAIGSIASAVTVAASSFDMTVTDPKPLLDEIDMNRLGEILAIRVHPETPLRYVEPGSRDTVAKPPREPASTDEELQGTDNASEAADPVSRVISGRVQTLGDFIDTDALAPAEALVGNLSKEEIGQYCLYHTHPDFRRRIKEDGLNIVVAGKAFGVGSSRENAVTALQGAGVKCVIARSFAFIYARNQPNLGMMGIVMTDGKFYELAHDGEEIEIDVDQRVVRVGGQEFGFNLSELERQLWECGGMSPAFTRWGKDLLGIMTSKKVNVQGAEGASAHNEQLQW
ncbi:aconitase iron-sulfur domain-containing protein [Rhizodiscina lignyota]|uniref:Aconitase iron-sulfur domain-containing protein n=1 Tax=Rhizodiscina lignyota TaxID=1504668 RepID=A0A9P4ME85_9PEZI|nr:aconitase iron-sulfur domain-containing protein [Rhizodiscina lignyota]